MPTSHAVGWMGANFSCASANFCVMFWEAFFRPGRRPNVSLTRRIVLLMLGRWSSGVFSFQFSVFSGKESQTGAGNGFVRLLDAARERGSLRWSRGERRPEKVFLLSTVQLLYPLARRGYLPPPDISGHFLPGTGDAARERGSLRWWRKETGMANGCGFGVVLFMLPEVRILLSLV